MFLFSRPCWHTASEGARKKSSFPSPVPLTSIINKCYWLHFQCLRKGFALDLVGQWNLISNWLLKEFTMNNSNFICVTLSRDKMRFTSTDGYLKSLLEHQVVLRALLAAPWSLFAAGWCVTPAVGVRGTLQGQSWLEGSQQGSGWVFWQGLPCALCTGAGGQWPNGHMKTAFQMWNNANAQFGTDK